jgi:hypothetical protein
MNIVLGCVTMIVMISLGIGPAQTCGAEDFEVPPTLDASKILKPEYLSGPNFKVNAEVSTYSGNNHFKINSDFGPIDAGSNQMLSQRVAEMTAIAELREISKSEEFADSLQRAGRSPFLLAEEFISHPTDAISGIPQGVWKSINNIGQALKEKLNARKSSDYEDNALKTVIGFSKAKRELALRVGVSPYSSNAVLQRELNSVAWAAFAGGLSIDSVRPAFTEAGDAGFLGSNSGMDLDSALVEKNPIEIRLMCLRALLGLGIENRLAERFVENPAYTPERELLICDILTRLGIVPGKEKFVELAASAEGELDSLFFQQCIELIQKINDRYGGLRLITAYRQIPCCITKDGHFAVALHYDYLAWTQRVAMVSQQIFDFERASGKCRGLVLFISGDLSPRARAELTKRGVVIYQREFPGPLR